MRAAPSTGEWGQVVGIARLQLTLLMRKRVLLGLVTLWIVQALVAMQLGSAGVTLRLLLPTLVLTDLLVVAMACGVIADDAEHGTFAFVLSHGIERRAFLAGKLLPVAILAVAFAVIAHITTLAITPGLEGGSPVRQLLEATLVSLVRIVVIAAVTAWAAVALTNRYLAAVGSLAVVYGLPIVLRSVVSPASPGAWLAESFLPWRDSFDRVAVRLFSNPIAADTLAVSIVQPLLYATLFAALAVWTLERRDLAGAGS